MTITNSRIEIDGVPVLIGPTIDGRAAGGLVFRVGHADETLATAGITHLVEHLALHFSDLTTVHANGQTGRNVTHFHISGSADDVVNYLNEVVRSLASLPVARLEIEKSILRTEQAGRTWGPAPVMSAWRYGAQGYGLASFNELGLARLSSEDVLGWAVQNFTRGNAVAWLACDSVPENLRLTLPDGVRRPLPTVTAAVPNLPAYYRGRDGVMVMESIVTRSCAATVYALVLEQALFRELRQEGGYSYTAVTHYEPRDATHAVLTAMADSLPEKQDAVVGGFVDVLARLRVGLIPDADVATAVAKARDVINHPDAETLRLPGAATNEILGHDNLTTEELLAELDAITPAMLREVALEVHGTALLQVPVGGLEWAGFTQAPYQSETVVTGPSAAFIEHPDAVVVAGSAGVSVVGKSAQATVKWNDVAVVQAFPDGARTVIGLDGFQVHVEPTLLAEGAETIVSTIDSSVPDRLVVTMPVRDADDIPQPQPPARPQAAATMSEPKWRTLARKVLFGVISLLASFSLLGLVAGLVDVFRGATGSDAFTRTDVVTAFVILLLLSWWMRLLWRRVKKHE